jgi:hypothetical protein
MQLSALLLFNAFAHLQIYSSPLSILNRTIYKLPEVFYIHCAWSPSTGNFSLGCYISYQNEKYITVKI